MKRRTLLKAKRAYLERFATWLKIKCKAHWTDEQLVNCISLKLDALADLDVKYE